jgi:ribulose-phosphate 3-epimerase
MPAIIAGNQGELDEMFHRLSGIFEWVHLDFMDGVFVPAKSLTFIPMLPKGFSYEAHLMVENPSPWLTSLRRKLESITFHIESSGFAEALTNAKKLGYDVGVALNPSTPLSRMRPYLDFLDRVLVMTVEPGKYGAPFVPSALEKIRELHSENPNLPIEVDGAMNPENARKAREAGASIFASGSYIMRSNNIHDAFQMLMKSIQNSEDKIL